MADTLVVSEVFGPTIQGEGPHTGEVVGFIRLGGCNLTCSWCDTAYTWDAKRFDLRAELSRRPVDELVDAVVDMDVIRVVISGGEPLLQDKAGYGLRALAFALWEKGIGVDVETNGTIPPTTALQAHVDLFAVSPKLGHAGMPLLQTLKFGALGAFALCDNAILKVVCQDAAEVEMAAELGGEAGFGKHRIWVMPLGATREELESRRVEIAQAAIEQRVNYSGRLHVDLWGTERGR